MILLNVDEIIALHEKLIVATGGSHGLRDHGLLESAVLGALAAFGGHEVYPAPEEKAARLCFAIIQNHPFMDGNKRTGILTLLMTLRLNAIDILYSQQELISLGLGIADGSIDYHRVLTWIKQHIC